MSSLSQGSIVVPSYRTGSYFATHEHPDQDSPFKAAAFLDLLAPIATRRGLTVQSYADVGCGGGGVARLVSDGLRKAGHPIQEVAGYDISPHVLTLSHEGIKFYFEDFCKTAKHFTLVTLFDVVEHVPDPIGFLKQVSRRCDFIGLHIPLDRSLANCLLDRFHHRLVYPGHLIVLDTPSALNLLTMSGLMPLDYSYTHGYSAPSGSMTTLQKVALPFRWLIAHISPWLSSRTIGGVSLMVLCATETGLQSISY